MQCFSHKFSKCIYTYNFQLWLCRQTDGTKASSWAASSLTETDSSTPLPVLPEGFSQVQFLALGLGTENENLQIRSQGVVSEPDPEFSPPAGPVNAGSDLYGSAMLLESSLISWLIFFCTFICLQYLLTVLFLFFHSFWASLSLCLSPPTYCLKGTTCLPYCYIQCLYCIY